MTAGRVEPTLEPGTEFAGAAVVGRPPPGAGGVQDPEAARRAGMRGAIVVNEFHFARVTELMLDLFGPRWRTDGEMHLKYVASLFVGDELTPKARVLGEQPPGSGRLALDVWCENQRGERIAVGTATCTAGER